MNRDFISKNKKNLILIILLIMSLVMISLGNENKINQTISKGVNITTAIPIYITNQITGYFDYIFDSISEISELKETIAEYENTIRKYQKNYIEIERYKKNVEKEIKTFLQTNSYNHRINSNIVIDEIFSDEYTKYKLEHAEIISHGINDFFSTIIINIGSLDDIESGMPVIAFQDGHKGVVGQIINTTLNYSKIISLHNRGSDIGAIIGEPEYVCIVSGNDKLNKLQINYIDKRADISIGDEVYTMGEDSIFPKDIRIGSIIEKLPIESEFYQRAILKPYIDFNRLHEVFVIKKLPDKEIDELKTEEE